jgi:hypothetical protein
MKGFLHIFEIYKKKNLYTCRCFNDFFTKKFFGKIDFGHFLCPFFKRGNILSRNFIKCDHN